EPGQLARRVDVIARGDGFGVIERRQVQLHFRRCLGAAETELRAAFRAEDAERLRRRSIFLRLAFGPFERAEWRPAPGDDRRAARPLAHPAMTIAGPLEIAGPVAHRAAKAAAGEILGRHRSLRSDYICSIYSAGSISA